MSATNSLHAFNLTLEPDGSFGSIPNGSYFFSDFFFVSTDTH